MSLPRSVSAPASCGPVHLPTSVKPIVWVVDDSAMEAEAVRRALAPSYEVAVFLDGGSMLEALAGQKPPDVLVLDWEMPGLSGPEVCRYLRTNPATDALAILLLTVHGRQQELVAGLESGANDFLPKPFEPAELLARVGALARHRTLVERHRIQLELEREQWHQLAQALPQLVWVTRPDGTPEYLNQRWYEYTGATPGEIDAETWKRFFHPDDVPEANRRWCHSLATGELYEVEYRCRRHDGAWRWFLGRSQPVRDSAGRLVRWLGTCTDIHAQKEAERALRGSEERYRTLFESIDEGFCIIEMLFDSGGRPHDYRFLEANPAFERHTGLVGAVGRTIRELAPGHEAHWFDIYGRIARTGRPERFQQPARALGREYDVYAFRIGAPEEHRVAILFNDITKRTLAERALQERADFERQLIGIVSHDLRNPLQAILMGTGALFRRADELDEKTLKCAHRIQSATERATRLVRDLLDFTRARLGGGIPVQRTPANLHALVREVVEDVQTRSSERTLQHEQAGPGDGAWDAGRLVQVAQNLLTNAVKFSPPDTPITVRTQGEDDWVQLEVHNLGPPIPPEQLACMFQPFSRGQAHADAGHDAGHSVGLGLYIVDQLVRAHGGHVAVTSTAEAGTTFRVHLPRSPDGH
jgi:phosphoserine phosphatase RsbU/P